MALLSSVLMAGAAALTLQGSCPPPAPRPAAATADCAASAPIGQPFGGVVLQVVDGDTVCVAQGANPSAWVRVKLADGAGADGRAALMAAAFGRRVVCVAEAADADGYVARCALDGVSLGRLGASPAAKAQAAFWR